jgi:hypothetical protein
MSSMRKLEVVRSDFTPPTRPHSPHLIRLESSASFQCSQAHGFCSSAAARPATAKAYVMFQPEASEFCCLTASTGPNASVRQLTAWSHHIRNLLSDSGAKCELWRQTVYGTRLVVALYFWYAKDAAVASTHSLAGSRINEYPSRLPASASGLPVLSCMRSHPYILIPLVMCATLSNSDA